MKITEVKPASKITIKTGKKLETSNYKWWAADSKEARGQQMLMTATFLKEAQQFRQRQAMIDAKLYGNQSLFSFVGSTGNKVSSMASNVVPADRPTFNLVQSAADTLISRISQNRPSPVFLTDNSDYKERNLAKKLNNFILGELYQTKAYEKMTQLLRDAIVLGTGCMKIYRNDDDRVALDRVLMTELFIDTNEAIYGEPRQLFQMKLIDRSVLNAIHPGHKTMVDKAARATVDNSADSNKTVSDLVLVVEGWRLPSSKEAKDGRHTIACSDGVLLDEQYDKQTFPFVFIHYSPGLLGFWAQSLSQQLLGTQVEINSLLHTISKAIKLVGVPRVFQEAGSKVVRSHHNNDIGTIITYQGVKPSYEVAQCVPQELYAQLQRLIQYGYQQCGVSAMEASAQKPAGLNSGEAIRSYDDISTDRYAALSRRWDNAFIDLAYLIIDTAKEIAEDTGHYSTVYPNKNSAKEIDLPKASLLKDPFVIQCFNMSSLPKDPAGRMAKVAEMIQAGMISIKEGRRLLDYPDLSQMETLANSSEERIFKILDEIVEDGLYTQPDQFMDLALAKDLTTQYINLYFASKLEEDKQEMLINFYQQILGLMQAAMPPPPPMAAPGGAPNPAQAAPMPLPQSPLVPNAVAA